MIPEEWISALWWILFCCSKRLAIGRGGQINLIRYSLSNSHTREFPKWNPLEPWATRLKRLTPDFISRESSQLTNRVHCSENIFAAATKFTAKVESRLKCPLMQLNHAPRNQKPSSPSRVQNKQCHLANPRSDFAAIHSRATPALRNRLPAIFHGALPIAFYFHTFFYPKYSRNARDANQVNDHIM